MKTCFFTMPLLFSTLLFGQIPKDSIQLKKLEEVVVTSSRIDLEVEENSRSIQILSQTQIRQSGVTNVADLLQQVAGIDIRRRGAAGTQADLYIRGGNFDQTLLLIDGIKVEDAQTGHHLLNFSLPLQVIERIEIVRGPAAREFGQNAFTGAINVVTKNQLDTNGIIQLQAGSFQQRHGEITVGKANQKSSILAHYSSNNSQGYRYNSDYHHHNAFLKAVLNKTKTPLTMIASFADRAFGANGFYALPSYADQYEETQASLLALSTKISKGKWLIKPKTYWRRGQDMYLFSRENPAIYRNLHITHKAVVAIDAAYISAAGITGLGVDIARISISSNNLGDRHRWVSTLFAEHRFQWAKSKFDLTPGIAISNYTDFGFQLFPGVDLGYQMNEKLRLFANIGYTYRIPTFTDLYYNDPTTQGNENLKAEEALTEEVGIKLNQQNWLFSLAAFHRGATNLIDYIRPQINVDRFVATNLREVRALGLELDVQTRFDLGLNTQRISLGYAYLDEKAKNLDVNLSRYRINSLRHHLSLNYQGQVRKNITLSVNYKFAQRPRQASYQVVDASMRWLLEDFQFSLAFNNLFNERYTETNQLPMPLGNGLLGVQYLF